MQTKAAAGAHPVWDCQVAVEHCAEGEALVFEVFDRDLGRKDGVLGSTAWEQELGNRDTCVGRAEISGKLLSEAMASGWDSFELRELPLLSDGSPAASLRVKVAALGDGRTGCQSSMSKM